MKTEKDTGGPAFPLQAYEEWNNTEVSGAAGMTLRDYFAAKALQALIQKWDGLQVAKAPPIMSAASYAFADAMLAERAS